MLGWLIDVREDEREIVEVRATTNLIRLHIQRDKQINLQLKEEGGAASFLTRSSALRLLRGVTVGGFVLATAIDSRLLCPGTPSKVAAAEGAAPADLDFSIGLGRAGVVGPPRPSLSEAARVIRGATTGGAVEATVMVSARL